MPVLPDSVFAHLFVPAWLSKSLADIYAQYPTPYPVEAQFSAMVEDVVRGLREVEEYVYGDPSQTAHWRAVRAALQLVEAIRAEYRTATGRCSHCQTSVHIRTEVERSILYSIAADGQLDEDGQDWHVGFVCARCDTPVQVNSVVRDAVIETLRKSMGAPSRLGQTPE
jgi:hypothetical protein